MQQNLNGDTVRDSDGTESEHTEPSKASDPNIEVLDGNRSEYEREADRLGLNGLL